MSPDGLELLKKLFPDGEAAANHFDLTEPEFARLMDQFALQEIGRGLDWRSVRKA